VHFSRPHIPLAPQPADHRQPRRFSAQAPRAPPPWPDLIPPATGLPNINALLLSCSKINNPFICIVTNIHNLVLIT
jgi:hypothetical protein